ncbi:hypothetical protein [Streptomyces chrestomyceticus]|uniref:Uncharacterized protein n=1 Tax=Streptomyces chrestomyceticus TaxID=68185 RepID=A0ABU7X1K3_9ACTN
MVDQRVAETDGKAGREPACHLTTVGLKALAEGNELPPRLPAGKRAQGHHGRVRAALHRGDGDVLESWGAA